MAFYLVTGGCGFIGSHLVDALLAHPEVAAIYFISSVPFRVEPRDLLAVVGFALLVTLAACFLPAWRAARVDPSSALRYE